MEDSFFIMLGLVTLAFIVLMLASLWKIFEKTGHPGWASIVPIYNLYILTKIVNKPGYWVILMIIPYVNVVFSIWTYNLLAKGFGKDSGFTVGLIFLPFLFFPILGFGDARWLGASGSDDTILDADLV